MNEPVIPAKELCYHHEWEEFIDPQSGGFVRCKKCGQEADCEEDEGW